MKMLLYNLVPGYLFNYFSLLSDTHSYSTRGSTTDSTPFHFKSLKCKATCLDGAAVQWNNLPTNLKLSVSLWTFKVALKKWL